MSVLQRPLQRRLSAALGAEVTFERLNVSLLGGSIDARGIVVAGDDSSVPVLTIKRVRAEIAIGRALKGEVVIKSLTVDAPVVTIVRRADGQTNIPRPMGATDDGDDDSSSAESSPDNAEDQAARGKWKFAAQKILLVDGEVHYRSAYGREAGYHASADRVLAEATQKGGGFEFTCVADSVGRRDEPAELGAIKAQGKLNDAEDLSRLDDSSLQANVDIVGQLFAKLECSKLGARRFNADLDGAIELSKVIALLPVTLSMTIEKMLGLRGKIELGIKSEFDPDGGIRVEEFKVCATDLALKLNAR